MKIEKIAVVTNYNISDKLAAAVTVSEKLSRPPPAMSSPLFLRTPVQSATLLWPPSRTP